MIVVGLTGGIGTGKSTVSALLAEKGAAIIDFDAIVHEVQPRLDCNHLEPLVCRYSEARFTPGLLSRPFHCNPRSARVVTNKSPSARVLPSQLW